MIGVFDSGFGGLVIMKELDQQFPEYSFMYLGDNARAPYGSRTPEEVYRFTRQAVEYLFAQGCELVILACNTASANALRRIQQELITPSVSLGHSPYGRAPLVRGSSARRILGILVPTVEQVHGGTIGIFATPGTVKSEAYVHEIMKHQPTAEVFQVACPSLVAMIEGGEGDELMLDEIKKYVVELKSIMGEKFPPDNVLLGCTHFPLVHRLFVEALPATVHVYDQAAMVALSLRDYLLRHLEIEEQLDKQARRIFLTTGNAQDVQQQARSFYDQPVEFRAVTL